jgi:hypothetical protein
LAIYAKGGESMRPKAKGPHHHPNFKKSFSIGMIFQIDISLCSKRGESSIFKINILKPSWTLRGGIYQGGVLFSQKEKHLKQWEKISNLENVSQNLIHVPLTICKRTLKRIYKRICKNKTCGASVVQNVKNKRNNPCISYKYLYWLNSKQPLHLHYAN